MVTPFDAILNGVGSSSSQPAVYSVVEYKYDNNGTRHNMPTCSLLLDNGERIKAVEAYTRVPLSDAKKKNHLLIKWKDGKLFVFNRDNMRIHPASL